MDTNEPTAEPRVYRIPEANIAALRADIAGLGRRAVKLGVPAPVLTELAIETSEPDRLGHVLTVHVVTVTGEGPKYDGWSLLAVIDRDREMPDGPHLVHVPGDENTADPAWRTVGDICDHCNRANTGRKKLVVVEHENGDRKIIGSTCLRDFLGGTSPDSLASWAELLFTLDERAEEFEGGGESHGEMRLHPVTFLAWVVLIIAADGWTPRSATEFGGVSTVSKALDLTAARWRAAHRSIADEYGDPTEAHETEAAAAVAWAQSLEFGDNDYLNNLVAVASKPSWRFKDLGLGGSMVSAYRRAMGQEAERAKRAEVLKDSDHVGAEKQRIEITGDVVFTMEREGYRPGSVQTLVKIITDDGNQLTWWANAAAPERGARVTGKATVKKHGEYNGIKETTITRFTWELVEVPELETCPC